MKIYGCRAQLIGDAIMALPILTYLEKKYPNSFKYWSVAKKISQAVSLFINHPLINQIHVTRGLEGPEKDDYILINSCDLILNVNPQHPDARYPNDFNIYEETFRMAGFSIEEYNTLSEEEKRPKLVKWFDVKKHPNAIALFAFAGYNRQPFRNPSIEWYNDLIVELNKMGYYVFQFGHDTESHFYNISWRFNNQSYFEQIKMALGCDFVINTDSGSGLAIGAYEHPQISLLTNHWPGHNKNFFALAPNNINNQNLFARNGCDNILIEHVIEAIKNI